MPTLYFPEQNSLRRALAGGGVAPAVLRTPATAGVDEKGRLWLTTPAWLPKETLAHLSKLEIDVFSVSSVPTPRAIWCWQELVPLEPINPTPERFAGTVLFSLPARRLAALAGEIERLGGHPWSCRWRSELADEIDDRMFLKTTAPPFCSMLRALDPSAPKNGIAAFVEQAPRVWVVAGWEHPFADQIQPPAGKALFLRPSAAWGVG